MPADWLEPSELRVGLGCMRLSTDADRDPRRAHATIARWDGDAAGSGKTSAPYLNPNRTGELRAEVEGLLADAREQWERWKGEKDDGARREAKRMVGDALLIWPDYPAAKKLLAEMG